MMLRASFITLFIAAFAANASAQDAVKLAPLSAASLELLTEDPEGPGATFVQGSGQVRRDSRLNGFLIGFAAGAIPGIWLGMGINTYCHNESAGPCTAMIPIAGGLFGLAGGGIGYAIDGAIGQSMTVGRPRPNSGVRFSLRF
jgi:hypothetical protein